MGGKLFSIFRGKQILRGFVYFPLIAMLPAALMFVVGVVWLRNIKGKEARTAMQEESKVNATHQHKGDSLPSAAYLIKRK